jgi:ABC-type taurine transport system substrate-binding protein
VAGDFGNGDRGATPVGDLLAGDQKVRVLLVAKRFTLPQALTLSAGSQIGAEADRLGKELETVAKVLVS